MAVLVWFRICSDYSRAEEEIERKCAPPAVRRASPPDDAGAICRKQRLAGAPDMPASADFMARADAALIRYGVDWFDADIVRA
ncbi:MAG: hypothetical protein VX463_07895, partial [Pseudomonadota bacterium]|nr:hypothetical protein [Pseudomonadota bacterium]